jgi:hypothetical protein
VHDKENVKNIDEEKFDPFKIVNKKSNFSKILPDNILKLKL